MVIRGLKEFMNDSTHKASYGVNREDAESILTRFLDNKDYKVLAVKGEWGVGKTYLVQNFLLKHQRKYYCYGSVFGISSIEQLKARILASYKSQIKSNNHWTEKYINCLFEWFSRISVKLEKTPKLDLALPGKLSIPIAGPLMAVAGDLALNILFNINVKNSIICIDDLERKSNLPLEEILGFVEYLVQELECKIILIYNESYLLQNRDNEKVLKDYREKVIDREFQLEPTVEENLDLIFKNHTHVKLIKEVLHKARTNNLRVIRKTKWLIDELIPLMDEEWEPSLLHQVIKNSILINLAKNDTNFCQLFSINSLDSNCIDTILSFSNAQKYYDKYHGENNESSVKRLAFALEIQDIGYTHLEYIDELISKLVDTSLSNALKLEFTKKGHILNQREIRNQMIRNLHEFQKQYYHEQYYNSFADNEKHILDGIVSFLQQHHLDLSLSQFEAIEKFTSILGFDISTYEKPLLEKILTEILEPSFYNNFKELRDRLHKYPDLEASLDDQISEYHQRLDITTALKKLMNLDFGSISSGIRLDIEKHLNKEFLNKCTIDEYSQWLERGHPDLPEMVRWFLKSPYQPASQNLEQAIRLLAQKTKLNKIRAKFLYSIDIDIPSNTNNAN
ncbi:P-loop NTPase fold protein [Anabaena sp. CS-542/02]|uniref:P-loop NTPase fold protein n=1 Tax=Anabaena sp. CS-542/02 TaxID=3021719 RepID=UPI0023300C02|nr:P-loop NTPase fold protein [Anabaena sp. CS-542/02]MDB9445634.1 hypothetical protein [Anabaena sp. CS-542/02]